MTFQQPAPEEPEGPMSPRDEARVRRQALRVGEELERRGMSWLIGPAAGRLEGEPHALYHIKDASGATHAFPTLDALELWLQQAASRRDGEHGSAEGASD
jgi:hypothetical protein